MDPLIPPSIQKAADAAGLPWNEYMNTLSPQDRADADREIVFYDEMRKKQLAAGNLRDFMGRTLSGPLPEISNPVLNASTPQGPTIEELEAGSQSPVLSTASTPQDPLLTNPEFIQMAESSGRTPEEHLAKLEPRIVEAARQILLGVEPEPPAPVLQTAVDPADRVGEEPGVLMRNEQNLVQDNIGQRQLLEERIARHSASIDTEEDVAILQQMQKKLVDLGGPVESNPSTSPYDAAAQAYLGQLRGQREQAAAVAPDIRAAEAEIASTTGLLSSGTLPPEMMASVQARKAAAEAALVSGNAARDARVADVAGSTLSVDNPVNGMTAQSLGVQLPGQEPGMNGASDYTRPPPVPVDNSGMPSGLGPYTVPTPPTPILAGNEPGMNGASDYSKPVLINTTTPAPATATATANPAAQAPVLSTKGSPASRSPVLSRGAGNMTANARGSNFAFARTPRGEALMRIGAAGYSGALQGDGIGAAGREYGSIQDADRDRAVKEAEFLEAQRVANARQAGINARAAAKGRKGMPSAQALMYGQAALNAIERTEALVAAEKDWAPWDNTTGIFGNLLKNFPATAANDVMQNIKTIEAAVGFDRLQAMRDASPTGGALGQVSNIELDLLKSSLANLNQSQSKGQFLTNLAQVKQVYNDIVNGPAGGGGAGSSNMSAADAIVGI